MASEFTVTCRKCGHEHRTPGFQPSAAAACPRCGAIYSKVEATLRATEVRRATAISRPRMKLGQKALVIMFASIALGALVLPHPDPVAARDAGWIDIVSPLASALGSHGARVALAMVFTALCAGLLRWRPRQRGARRADANPRRQGPANAGIGGILRERASGEWIVPAMAGVGSLMMTGVLLSALTLNLGAALSIFALGYFALTALLALGIILSIASGTLFFDPDATLGERPYSFVLGTTLAAAMLAAAVIAVSASGSRPKGDEAFQVSVQKRLLPWKCPDLSGHYLWDAATIEADTAKRWMYHPPFEIKPDRAELEITGPKDGLLLVKYRRSPPAADPRRGDAGTLRVRVGQLCTDGWVELAAYEGNGRQIESSFGLTAEGRLASRQIEVSNSVWTIGNARFDMGISRIARYAVHDRLPAAREPVR